MRGMATNYALNAAGDDALTSAFDEGYAQGRLDGMREVLSVVNEYVTQEEQPAPSTDSDES